MTIGMGVVVRGTLVRPAPTERLRLSLPAGGVQRVAAWGARLVLLAALAPIAIYVWTALHRLNYPYELDWLEGGGVEITRRAMEGQSLYTAPTLGLRQLHLYALLCLGLRGGGGDHRDRLPAAAAGLVRVLAGGDRRTVAADGRRHHRPGLPAPWPADCSPEPTR